MDAIYYIVREYIHSKYGKFVTIFVDDEDEKIIRVVVHLDYEDDVEYKYKINIEVDAVEDYMHTNVLFKTIEDKVKELVEKIENDIIPKKKYVFEI